MFPTKLNGDEFADVPAPSSPRVNASVQRAPQTAQKVDQQTLSISILAAHFPSSVAQAREGNSSAVCIRITAHKTKAWQRKYRDGRRKARRLEVEERSRGNIES